MAGLAALAGLGVAGCSLGGDDDSGAGGTGESSVTVGDDGTVTNALVSLTRPYDDYDVTVDVLRIKRFDRVMRLELAATPRSHGGTSDLPASFFSDSSSSDTGGIYLLDTSTLKKYPVLQSQDRCICSAGLTGFPLDRPTVLFADFPAAPESVKQLSVVVPAMGILPAVKLS